MLERFRAQIVDYAGREFIRKSVFSPESGAGAIERVLGGRRYKRALEIGTYRGVSSALMAQFCDTVVTIDLRNGKMERDRQVFDRVRFWEAMGAGNIESHLVDNDGEKAALISRLDFDFAFVDGDHEGDAPRRDFDLVKRCGTVLFHDYEGDNGVVDLVNSLPPTEVEVIDMFALWRAGGGVA